MRAYCSTSGYSDRCRQCQNDDDCENQGYPGDIRCDKDTISGFGVCSNCPADGCPGDSECENFKCVECSDSDDCDTDTPHCEITFQGNFCRVCTANSQCTNPALSKCDTDDDYICVICSNEDDCDHITGKPKCDNSQGCVECTQDGHCDSNHCVENICVECEQDDDCTSASNPVCGPSNTCIPCTNPTTVCSDNFPAKPICSTSGACVECKDHTDCTADPLKPECSSNTCQPCSGSTFCASLSINQDYCVLTDSSNKVGSCVECLSEDQCTEGHCDETTNTCVECVDHDDCTDDAKPRCEGNACQPCSDEAFCTSLGIGLDQCAASGKCVECTDRDQCSDPTHECSETTNTCVECTDDTYCTDPSTPFCGSGNTCQACPSDTFCATKYPGDLPYCVDGTCVECSEQCDCSDPTPYCSFLKTCVECTQDSECPSPSLAKCSSYTCQSCTGFTDVCSNRFSDKQICSMTNGECVECEGTNGCDSSSSEPQCEPASHTCVECTGDDHCQDPSAPVCSDNFSCEPCSDPSFCANKYPGTLPHCLAGTCVECTQSQDCLGSDKPNCIDNICKPTIYEAQCSPTYNIQVKQMSDPNLNQFDLNFPSDLVSKVDIKGSLTLTLLNVEESAYTYAINKLTSTYYQAIFTIQASIPATKLELTLPCPSQPGYIFGDILLDTNTKSIPYTTPEIQQTIETIQSLASTTTTVMASASGSMMIAGANPAIMWALIGLLQAFYYMIFINVNYPANLQAFFGLFTLGNLSFIPNPIGWFFPNIDDESLDAPSKFIDNDVNGLFLQTAGNMLLTWFLVLFGYIVSKFFLRFTRNMPKLLNTAAAKTVEIFEWSGVLRTFITSYTQLSMAAFLQIRVMDFKNDLFGVSSVSGLAFTVFAFLFPLALILLLHKFSKSPKLLKAKYSTLVEEFKLEQKNLTAIYFNAFFILKRLVLTLTLVFLHNYPYIEVFVLVLNCAIWTLLLVKFLPYNNKINNIVNILSEILFVAIHVIIFLFAHDDHVDWLTDQEKMDLGWVVIGCCGVILVLTLIASFVQQFFVVKRMIILLIKVIKGKKTDSGKKVKRKSSPQIHPQKPMNTSNLSFDLSETAREHLENSMSAMPSVPTKKNIQSSRRIVRTKINNKNRHVKGNVTPL